MNKFILRAYRQAELIYNYECKSNTIEEVGDSSELMRHFQVSENH